MTTKEKAEELIGKCYDTFIYDEDEHYTGTAWRLSKKCALIVVDEILNNNNKIPGNVSGLHTIENTYYWQEVKQEIQNL